MEKNMKIYEELQARGLLAQLTDPDEIRALRIPCTSATSWPCFS